MTASVSRPARTWFPGVSGSREKWFAGIDIGINRVEVTILAAGKQRDLHSHPNNIRWVSQHQFPLLLGEHDPPPPEQWIDILVDQLTKHLPRCVDGQRIRTAVSLPSSWLHYQTAPVDAIQSVQQQCDQMFARSVFGGCTQLTHWPIENESRSSNSSESSRHQFAATSADAVLSVATAIGEAGFQVDRVVPPAVAVLSAAHQTISIQPAGVILLNLDSGLIALVDQPAGSQPAGTANQNATSVLPSSCGLTRSVKPPATKPSECVSTSSLRNWLTMVAQEFDSTTRFARRLGQTIDPGSPILLAGQLASLPDIDTEMASLLERPVGVWRPRSTSRPSRMARDVQADSDRCVAYSLAAMQIPTSQHHGHRAIPAGAVR